MFEISPLQVQSGPTRTDELRREADARRLAGRTRLRRRVRARRSR